jgi:hypothetical protein
MGEVPPTARSQTRHAETHQRPHRIGAIVQHPNHEVREDRLAARAPWESQLSFHGRCQVRHLVIHTDPPSGVSCI